MLKRDFLRQILADKKRLLKLSKVKQIEFEKHEELSVVDLFGKFKNDEELMSLCTDCSPKECLLDCIQFFNILNSINLRIEQSLSRTYNNMHVTKKIEKDLDIINVSEEGWQRLN